MTEKSELDMHHEVSPSAASLVAEGDNVLAILNAYIIKCRKHGMRLVIKQNSKKHQLMVGIYQEAHFHLDVVIKTRKAQ